MQTPALFGQSIQLLRRTVSATGRIVLRTSETAFGRVSWNPPRWITAATQAGTSFSRKYPRQTTGLLIVLLLLGGGTAWAWRWYANRPKPHTVQATIAPIPVTPLERHLVIPLLNVQFSEPAARLEDLRKTEVRGVRLDPEMPGAWFWSTDQQLTFRPREDWPADRKFRVIFDKRFFPAQVRMDRFVYEVTTPPFTIKVIQKAFYQDPINPTQRQVTATFELSHAIATGELDRHIQLSMIGGSPVFQVADQGPHFTLTYGLHRRLVYLRSSPITLPDHEDFMKLMLSKGVHPAQGGAETSDGLEEKVRVPSIATMFRIDSIQGTVVRNKKGEPEQLLILKTSADISTRDLAKSTEIWLLPKRKAVRNAQSDLEPESGEAGEEVDGDEDGRTSEAWGEDSTTDKGESALRDSEKWKSATDVPETILAEANRIEFRPVPSDKAFDRQHTFRVSIEKDGEIYLRVTKGVKALGDYPLADTYNAVVPVPLLPREIQIEGEGGLLALNGERKLLVRSRALAGIEYEIARVATTQINHLVSQTTGEFEHPYFKVPYYFNQENISRIAFEHQSIALENRWKANYSTFDFSEHLRSPADGGSERGLFFLTARGWNPIEEKAISSVHDGRFLLITDLGILTKKNGDGSYDVFLISIKNGTPIEGATVEILARNGTALLTARTDGQGHCAFSSVDKSRRDQLPVAFVARKGDDVAFIPYSSRRDRVLNFSRFDIDGVENVLPENLDAFLFTERGVYRPGDQIHAGLIVKQRNWQGQLEGLPVETEVVDARGLAVQTRKLALPASGFTEFSYQTANESPTGLYSINVYLMKNSRRATLLGSTTANVKEFLPDRMKINARLSQKPGHGWLAPNDLRALIELANLYGTPATDRRVLGKITLCPTGFRFTQFSDYTFYDPLADSKNVRHTESVDLGEKKTDTEGHTEFNLQLERFADATYAMHFTGEGFEGEGGRSVIAEADALISALPYVIGCKADGNLDYIELNKSRALDFVAVDPQLNRIAIENLTLNVIAQEYVSVLTKQDNGDYAYQSVLKELTAHSERITVSANGLHYPLSTVKPGNYALELRDDNNRRLTRIPFCVVGRGAVSRSLEKSSELEIKLDRAQYNSGDQITISITAPYAGNGLITIERDKVYAFSWFQTTTASSVQHIVVPADFDGSGYVNVAFVRALDSKEIFTSPLSYGVAPFTANMEKHRLKIDIAVPSKTEPGRPLRIAYRADRQCKIVLFAVDEGILQVTDYATPDPLEFFFRKCALRVETAQIVDLIIPEFSILRSVSAFGGGGDVQHLNPFKRFTEKPVVFWSGIIDADTTSREVTYDVPDFFDGNLKVMAVAVADTTTGSAEENVLVRGPFVITPSVPVLAAPGDEFEAGVTIANNLESSGADTEIELRVETGEALSVEGSPVQKLRIGEGREQSTTIRFRVNDKLGSAEIRFIASAEGRAPASPNQNPNSNAGATMQRRATLSVRPPVPYMTEVRSGSFTKASAEIPMMRQMYPEFRKLSASVSALPLGLAPGLDLYLKNFPHGCSEQITSGAFCRLLLSDESDFGLSRAEVNEQLEYTFGVLSRRQNDQGAFGYWAPENGEGISFVSVYVMDFLSEAKAAGFAPPVEMFSAGLRNLQKMVTYEPRNFSDAQTLAYAIHVLTREGVITTNYILNLRDYLEKRSARDWQNDTTGIYLAGALRLLHKEADGEKLIDQYRIDRPETRYCDDFHQELGANSQYIAVLAREFPARLKKFTPEQFEQIIQPVKKGEFNTLSAAYAVRALKAYAQAVAQNSPELSIAETDPDNHQTRLVSGTRLLQRSSISGRARAVQFQSDARVSGPGLFFQVIEAGFDRSLPREPLTNGLEVYRELLDKNNQPVSQTSLGDPVRVRLHVRSLRHQPVTNVAIVDLLPGGFEVVDSSIHRGPCSMGGVDYVDIREDRAVFFATVPVQALEIDYKIKSCNRGDFVVPPVFAESMYDRNIKGRGIGGRIKVIE